MKQPFFIILILNCLLSACHTNEDRKRDDTAIYADYRISGEEEEDNVTCFFQFRPSSSSAQTIQPLRVALDNEELKADSTPLTGIYYEALFPSASFNGTHTIVFTDAGGKQYKEVFEYNSFKIRTALPAVISRHNLTLQLTGLQDGDAIRVVIVDTSFTSNGINELKAVTDNRIILTKEQFNKVASGPITLQLIKEEEQPLSNPPKNGGHISISYGLTRDLELKD